MLEKILILGLTTYRITRFFIEDSLINKWRERLVGKGDTDRGWFGRKYQGTFNRLGRWLLEKTYILITCAFCLSLWVSIAVWNLYDRWVGFAAGAHVLAVAAVVAIIYDMRPDDIEDELKKYRQGKTD